MLSTKSEENENESMEPKVEMLAQQYSMLNYAKLYFVDGSPPPAPAESPQRKNSFVKKITMTKKKKEKHQESPVSWGWMDLVKKIKFTKVPIETPLTKLYDPEDQTAAVETFKGFLFSFSLFFFFFFFLFLFFFFSF